MDLVRREKEAALLEELLGAALRGEPRAVRVTGGPGTGKSTLLADLARRARRDGALVLSACASPAEDRLSLGVAGQLLSPVTGAALARALPDEAAAPAALHATVRELADDRPVVVLVDDVQHTDEASARCLLYLCGRLDACGVLLVLSGAARTPLPLPLAELLRHPRCAAVGLSALDVDAVEALLCAAGVMEAQEARRFAARWHRFTGGNPRLLGGLVDDHRACAPVRALRPVAGTAFRGAVTDCLRGTGQRATDAARALAVLGDAATLTLLARLLDIPERAVTPLLDALDEAGLLDGGRLRHEGVRAAVLAELPVADAAALHIRVAGLLYETGAEAPLVARHLAAAGVSGSGRAGPRWAAPLLAHAARQALEAGCPPQAATFLRTAAGCTGGDARRGAALREMLARAEWETDPAIATRHLDALERDVAEGRHDAESASGVGLLLWHGRPASAERALTNGEHTGLAAELAASLHYSYPGAVGGRTPRHGGATTPRDLPGKSAERSLEAIVYEHAPAPGLAAVLCMLLHAGQTRRAEHWAALTQDVRGLRATPARRAVATAVAAVARARIGAYDDAARYVAHAFELLSPQAWGVAVGMPLAAAVTAATGRGALEEAKRYLAVPVPEAMFATRAGLHYLLARGRYRLAAGRPHTALGDFHACRDLLVAWELAPSGELDWRPWAAKARWAAGPQDDDPIARLSTSERRVAVLAARGCTNRAIAAHLCVTPSTVEQHLTRIYRKLRVRSRTGLADLVGAGPTETSRRPDSPAESHLATR
ncbi:AAA family ATPase [Streptomyces monashensis]|uniref:HTH luxR-type domain-containing protein n=1 Tax=Streptomyces monashensis TaxID=1678012 RepID=A0A1S2QK48_9ACTN|nr:LuxR family transcriptional regulator [Streptomyces monashensis]OIK06007.1 hypothetical protein BIV23_09940 [Streptomyces monashensis]